MNAPGPITMLLRLSREGDATAMGRAFELTYAELKQLARRALRNGQPTLDTTALVHECYVRLVGGEADARDRGHFMALAARAMRQIVCDHARRRLAQKRGSGDVAIELEPEHLTTFGEASKLLELDELLERLAQTAPRQANVVECRVFGGMSVPETAAALKVSDRTVELDWQHARAWLVAQQPG